MLEVFYKHRAHLQRGDKQIEVFLKEYFDEYLNDIKIAIKKKDNHYISNQFLQMLEERYHELCMVCDEIIEVLLLYRQGAHIEAGLKAFSVFDRLEEWLIIAHQGAWDKRYFYRIRCGSNYDLDRKAMYHIPLGLRNYVSTARYSMPGYPCLYLANQKELCWYECGKPSEFAIAKFEIPQQRDDHLILIDFSEKLMPLMHSFISWYANAGEDAAEIEKIDKYFLKVIFTFPLRAACSLTVARELRGCSFKEEYIIPQFLIQWIAKNEIVDGVRYESNFADEDVHCLGGYNIVLVSKKFDEEGYAGNIRSRVKVGEPKSYNVGDNVADIFQTNFSRDTLSTEFEYI